MIVDKIVQQKIKQYQIQEFIEDQFQKASVAGSKLQMTPLGEKVIISASRPGLVVGRRGQSIKRLTHLLKKRFNLENPQIEIVDVENPNLNPRIIAERIANSLERFGIQRFKGIGHKAMEDAKNAGALGIEILMSGKIPSARARRWRFYQGYLKKSGDIAMTGVDAAYNVAKLKTGIIGIQVRIMPPTTELPDKITFKDVVDDDVLKALAMEQGQALQQAKIELPKKKAKRSPRKHASKKVVQASHPELSEHVQAAVETSSSESASSAASNVDA